MGFKETKAKVIECLRQGNFAHEPRKDINANNLLHTQVVSPTEVVEMVLCCSGSDHKPDFHDADRSVPIHILKPKGKYDGWYIKFYFVADGTMFISVHN